MKKCLAVLLALVCLALTGCQSPAPVAAPTAAPAATAEPAGETAAPGLTRFSGYFMGTFDTVVTLIGFAESQEAFDQVLKKVEARFVEMHQTFDKYNSYPGVNNLLTLNQQAAQGPVVVNQDMMTLLQTTLDWQKTRSSSVNIALGSVLALWHNARETATYLPENAYIPSQADLEAAAAHTDSACIVLDPEAMTVTYTDPLLQLDLGAVAKGYAAERVVQEILLKEMPHFILNAGGNVRTGMPPLDGRKAWGIGIQDPAAPVFSAAESKDVLYFANQSLVTSGTYQRYFELDGVRYHHLISPVTLMPANHCESLTIVTEDSFLADFLSTACFLLPYEESRALVDSQEGVEALWIFNDGTTQMTDGLKPMAKSQGATNSN